MGNKRERNENVWGLREREALTFDNPALRWNVKYTCVRKQRKRWASELYNEDEKEACRVRVQLRLVVEITTTCMYTIRPTPCGVALSSNSTMPGWFLPHAWGLHTKSRRRSPLRLNDDAHTLFLL